MENSETEKAVYKLNVNCGRQGNLTGLFIAKKSYVKKLIDDGIEVYFGEVLGKHSEIYGTIEEKEIIFVSDNSEVIKIIEEHELESGYNPFHYHTTGKEDEDENMEDATVEQIIEKRLLKNL